MNWLAFLSAGGGAMVLAAIQVAIKALSNRKLVQANAAELLSGTSVEQVNLALDQVRNALERVTAAEDRATRAEGAAEQARRDASEARMEAVEARREAMAANREWRILRNEILSPNATLERLRALVSDQGPNGTAGIYSSK